MRIETFPLGPLETNCHVLSFQTKALVVDPGGDPAEVLDYLAAGGLTLEVILNTHLHCDHLYGNAALSRATGAPILASPLDAYLMKTELGRGGFMGLPLVAPFTAQDLNPGETTFLGQPCTVLHTPGHTLGSLSLYFPTAKALFSGDLLFYRGVGRSDFPGGSHETLIESVRTKIFTLPEDTTVYSGHGLSTTVHEEKLHNPYFSAHGF